MSLESIADWVVEFVKAREAWAAPIVFVLAFGESIAFVSLILPFWGMLVAIGALIADSPGQFAAIWIAASVGAALGDWVSFWLGYHYHAQIAKMWPLSRYPDLLPKGHAFFEKYGAWAIVLARFSGPFRASVPIVAGAAEMNWIKFQTANWASAFLWAYVLLVFGDIISQTIQVVGRWLG
jgi:membrane protein DedA with SNARE-associated domain